jgi:hypothetical protein
MRVKNNLENTSQKIGIFWFLPTRNGHRFISLAHDVSRVDLIGGFKTIDEGHVDIWPKVVAADRTLRRFSYEYFPRGRINWREEDNRFILLADLSIFKRNLHQVVTERWNLSEEAVHPLDDAHYRTNKLPSFFRGGHA